MTTDRTRCPPAPPPSIDGRLLLADLDPNPEELVRVHWDGKPALNFSISRHGNRFDPLAAPYAGCKVLYAGTTLEVAIAETVLRWRDELKTGARIELSTATKLRGRRVARFRPTRPLRLIDATRVGLDRIQAAVDATVARPQHQPTWATKPVPLADDIFLCRADEYATTQAWGAWFRLKCPDADGLQWASRQFDSGQCIVLFDDRCANDLVQIGDSVDLLEPGSVQEQALDALLAQLEWTRS